MHAIARCLAWLRSLDDLSRLDSPLHRVHPAAAIAVTVAFLLAVMSVDRYEAAGLLPFFAYPCLVVALSGIPAASILLPLLLIEPLIICIGLLNPLLDTQPVLVAGHVLARGWLVLFSLVVKCSLAVSGALLLAAILGIERLSQGLRRLGVPGGLVLQLILTYRYLWILLEEAGRILLAYSLRSGKRKGIRYRDWGAVAGGLLLRTYGRAERIYQAMRLRGFDGEFRTGRRAVFRASDFAYVAGWLAFFLLVRMYNMPAALGAFFI